MNVLTLLLRSLRHYARPHLWVLLGVMITATVITGALAVGDSVRYSLHRLALLRLGNAGLALDTGDRFVRDALGAEIGDALRIPAAAVLQRHATANTPDESAYAGRILVYGVTPDFRAIAGSAFPELKENEAAVNPALAQVLRLRPGDAVVIRLPDPLRLPGDALPGNARHQKTLPLRVTTILSAEAGGNYQLRNLPAEEPALFLPLPTLQTTLNLPGLCNQILLAHDPARPLSLPAAEQALREHFSPADAGLRGVVLPAEDSLEFRSRSVLIPPQVEKSFLAQQPTAGRISTYFAESIESGDRSTPYSFLSAAQNCRLPAPAPGKIILTDWLARDLGIDKPGATVTVRTQALAADGRLHERQRSFTVESIVPVDAAHGRTLMPNFPGFTGAASCRNWDPDLPVDLARIRPQDEAYWEQYQGTPKGYLNLEDARTLWGSSFGFLTALRTNDITSVKRTSSTVSGEGRSLFQPNPASLGFFLQPVRAEALQAGSNGVDFGQLFLSLSFFLILAALLLTALFFAFAAESRAAEDGTLRALGFRAARVRRLLLLEGGLAAVAGSAAGSVCGILYCRAVIAILNANWQGAIGQTHLWPHVPALTLLYGGLSTLVMAVAAFAFTLRRGGSLSSRQQGVTPLLSPARTRLYSGGGLAGIAGAVVLLLTSDLHTSSAALFFGAGSLLLGGGLLCAYGVLRHFSDRSVPGSFGGMALRQAARRPGRALAVLAALACGIFLVVSVGVNRTDPAAGAGLASSGAGGYTLYAQTTLTLPADLNSASVRNRLGLNAPELAAATFVPLRLLGGDDASCLNLNRVNRPPLIGIPPELFRQRGAFTFQNGTGNAPPSWSLLQQPSPPGEIPAAGDQSMLTWGLGKKIGDTIPYTAEDGTPLQVNLCGGLNNSIFQGSLLVPEQDLLRAFPTGSAIRGLLVDAPRPAEAAAALRKVLRAYGITVEETAARLERFSRVEDTYLTIFLLLGGLGLILGSAGLGILLLRNAWERRQELALLRAVGYPRRRLALLLLCEHAVLLSGGVALGLLSSLAAALPALVQTSGQIPYADLILVLLLLVLNAVFWTVLSARAVLRQPLLNTLRTE